MLKQNYAGRAPFWPQRSGIEYVTKFTSLGNTARSLDGSEVDENSTPDQVLFRKKPPLALTESRALRVHQRAGSGTPKTETNNFVQSYLEPDVFEADLSADTFKLTRTLKSESENSWNWVASKYQLYTEFQGSGPLIAVTEGTRFLTGNVDSEKGWERHFTVDRATGTITTTDPFADDWFSSR